MKPGCLLALVMLSWLGMVPVGAVEVVSIPSLDGKLQLPGHWFEASASGPLPVVISLHGCAGLLDDKGRLGRNRQRVAGYLNVERMHVLAVDSFTPRGVKSICETPASQRPIRYEHRRDDVFGEFTQQVPW